MTTDGKSERLRILLVDDEPTICRALTIAFSRAGYDIRTVEHGEAVFPLLRSEPIDGMIIDFRLQDLRGDVVFETAATIQPHLRDATLFTTGDISDFATEMIEACRCPVLAKPFDLTELITTIDALARKARDARSERPSGDATA